LDGQYVFNLDPVRIPQKYPGKRHFKGEKKGQLSTNPLGKNPGDFWAKPSTPLEKVETSDVWISPNVKHNHIDKTIHPCQFPVELVERLVLALTNQTDLVVDPYMGVGSSLAAAIRHGRRAAGAEIVSEYVAVARERSLRALAGILETRPLGREVYVPPATSSLLKGWDSITPSDD
jgi:adenine-specific DNA-methyltransferase